MAFSLKALPTTSTWSTLTTLMDADSTLRKELSRTSSLAESDTCSPEDRFSSLHVFSHGKDRFELNVKEAPDKDTSCSNGILPNSVSAPPHPTSTKRTLCGRCHLPKISKFFKTAILNLGMGILTTTMAKHDS